MSGSVIIYGDPHGEWRPLLRACAEDPPDGVVLLGDCDLDMPLRRKLAPVFDAGIHVRWIPGNHDTETEAYYDHLWGDYPQGNIHAGPAEMGDMVIVGLGGIFKDRVWYPRVELAEPTYLTRQDCVRRIMPVDRWRGGLPLLLRDAIFPEDVRRLKKLKADVLVTHEAPSAHRHGFVGVDEAARLCRARLVVHGHHHRSYDAVLPTGIPVRGLARAEVLRLRREDLA